MKNLKSLLMIAVTVMVIFTVNVYADGEFLTPDAIKMFDSFDKLFEKEGRKVNYGSLPQNVLDSIIYITEMNSTYYSGNNSLYNTVHQTPLIRVKDWLRLANINFKKINGKTYNGCYGAIFETREGTFGMLFNTVGGQSYIRYFMVNGEINPVRTQAELVMTGAVLTEHIKHWASNKK